MVPQRVGPIVSIIEQDDNAVILDRLKARLELGLMNYGHGVQASSGQYNWRVMAEEEILDGLIYAMAAIVRANRLAEWKPGSDLVDGPDDDPRLLHAVKMWNETTKREEALIDRCDDLIAFILSNHEETALPEEVYTAISDHVNEGNPHATPQD